MKSIGNCEVLTTFEEAPQFFRGPISSFFIWQSVHDLILSDFFSILLVEELKAVFGRSFKLIRYCFEISHLED